MKKNESGIPFATFPMIKTDGEGKVICQNRRAMRAYRIRKGSCLYRFAEATQEGIAKELAQNGYAAVQLSEKWDASAWVIPMQDGTLFWLFLEELQQSLMRDTLLSRPDALCRAAKRIAQSLEGKQKEQEAEPLEECKEDRFSQALRVALRAQTGSVTKVDAASFLEKVLFPLLKQHGVLGTVQWEGKSDLPLPVSLANTAMTFLHSIRILTSCYQKITVTVRQDADGVSLALCGKRKRNRMTISAQKRRLALDLAIAEELLQREDCQLNLSFSDPICCYLRWNCDCHAIAYLGSDSAYLTDQIYEISDLLQRGLALNTARTENP